MTITFSVNKNNCRKNMSSEELSNLICSRYFDIKLNKKGCEQFIVSILRIHLISKCTSAI